MKRPSLAGSTFESCRSHSSLTGSPATRRCMTSVGVPQSPRNSTGITDRREAERQGAAATGREGGKEGAGREFA
eukprot:5448537-Prymnesium_polylepis.1